MEARLREGLPDIVAITPAKAIQRLKPSLLEAIDPVGTHIEAELAVGQEVGHHRAGAGTEAEPDVPVAEGEDRIAMARRAADDRHGVRHRGAEAIQRLSPRRSRPGNQPLALR